MTQDERRFVLNIQVSGELEGNLILSPTHANGDVLAALACG